MKLLFFLFVSIMFCELNPAYSAVKILGSTNPNKRGQVFFKKDDPNYWSPSEPN
jgi:hypothetical protein